MISEIASAQSPLESALTAGLESIAQQQTIQFTQYTRLILPADGFVFWVKTSNTLSAKGSLHYSGDQNQNVDETIGITHVIFTSEVPIDDFNEVSPTKMYIGEFESFKFSFNHTKNFYRQASLWHYMGNAVYPAMETQLLDAPETFDNLSVIVSNSLPIWLSLNAKCPMYPSFLVDPNIAPPYCSVHIEPSETNAIQAVPSFSSTLSHTQLTTDMVLMTLYGLNNSEALDFQDYLFQYSLDTDDFGLMNTPVMRDEKRTQSEINVIAQKKTFEMQISYYQSRVAEVSRKLIRHALVTFLSKAGG